MTGLCGDHGLHHKGPYVTLCFVLYMLYMHVVQSPHVVAQSNKLIRDHWNSDICAANLTVTINDAIVFRTNGKGGAIVDPIKFEYMSPTQRGTRRPINK